MRMVDIAAFYDWVRAAYGRAAKGLHPWVTLPPLRVTFEITYRCNLSCPFCFQEHAREQSGELGRQAELSNEEIVDIIALTSAASRNPWRLGGTSVVIRYGYAVLGFSRFGFNA